MTPERWREVESLFERVADLSPNERSAQLDLACSDDTELRAEVESLLSALAGAPARLHAAVGQAAQELTGPEPGPAMLDRVLGNYRVLAKLGEGGMGVVYLAERVDGQYHAKVAIKLLSGQQSQDAVARFRDERQILATLEHPGIVRLIDGGSTDTGQPYLVMEYVAGVPISIHVEQRRLSLPDRLELFNRAAAAVAFAHQRLVIHRDLKPSNILVTADASPKLLDFGIAKLLAAGGHREASTQTGMQLLTPEYASPEQVRGGPISTATDIYSLGAVLYELCAGTKAQPVAGESVETVLRVILNTEPPRPSTVAPPAYRRALAGDLDNIILKALHKQPDKRYGSVQQLIDDIERHLGGLPVKARAATLAYRAGKFVRRNAVSVVAAGVVSCGLSSATVVSLQQARRADEQAADAEHQRQLAQTQATLADEQASIARARARIMRDTLRVGAALQAVNDPTLAISLLREVESAELPFGWLRAVPHFLAPAFVTTTTIGRDAGRTTVAAWSPDGALIVAAWPTELQVWRADGTQVSSLEGDRARAHDLAWSPDSTHFVTASGDSIARVFRADGELVAELAGHDPLAGSGLSVAWSPDGTQISTAAADKTVRLWTMDGAPLATLTGHSNSEIWAKWSPDGSRLLSGSPWDPTLRVWRSDGTLGGTLDTRSEAVLVAAWSPDARAIVTGSSDAMARIWGADDGQLQAVLDAGEGRVVAAAWSPDGRQLALGSTNGDATVWEADGTSVATLIGHGAAVIAIQWSPDGRWIATASEDHTARVWQPDGARVGTLAGHRNSLRDLAWRPNSKTQQLLTTAADGTVRVWQPEINLPSVSAHRSGGLVAVAWSPDGTRVAMAAGDHTTRIWQHDDDAQVVTLEGHAGGVRSVLWSPDGDWLLTTSEDHTARVWRSDGSLHASLGDEHGEVLAAAWGSEIATAHADGTARIWRRDGTLLATLTGHDDAVRSVAWSADGGRLLTASWDTTARIWQRDGRPMATLTGHEQAVQAAAWSPDGSRIATASMDHSARIWRSDGTLVAVLAGHSEIESVTWSNDSSRLVTTSIDHVAQIWTADGALFASLGEHAGEITSVVWRSDSAQILTTSSTGIDGSARLWSSDGTLLATIAHRSPVVSGGFGPGNTHVRTATANGEVRAWLIEPTALLRGFWLSTPHCIDAPERQRVLAETPADAAFAAATCRAMQICLRDDAGEAVPERFDRCLAQFHARRDTHDLATAMATVTTTPS